MKRSLYFMFLKQSAELATRRIRVNIFFAVMSLSENRQAIRGDVAASLEFGQRNTELCNSSNRISIMQYLLRPCIPAVQCAVAHVTDDIGTRDREKRSTEADGEREIDKGRSVGVVNRLYMYVCICVHLKRTEVRLLAFAVSSKMKLLVLVPARDLNDSQRRR